LRRPRSSPRPSHQGAAAESRGQKTAHNPPNFRRPRTSHQNRSAELTRKVNETFVPKLEKLSGFGGYWLMEADHGVFSSLSLFGDRVPVAA
jgi:hypothetical protein